MANTYYRKQYALNWLVPELKFTTLDNRVIGASVLGTQESWKQISGALQQRYLQTGQMARQLGSLSKLLQDAKTQQLVKVQQQITQGFIQGYSIKQMSSGIMDVMDSAAFQADRIARTEGSRTANLANQLASIDAQNQGVKLIREWVAALDNRTRSLHAQMDGRRAEVDKPFKAPDGREVMRPGAWGSAKDDINERCTTIDIVIVDGEEKAPALRRARNPLTGQNEVINNKDFSKWAKAKGLKKNKYGQYYAS